VELVGDAEAIITATLTVPPALPGCRDLTYLYDHPGTVVVSSCQIFFKEMRLTHTMRVRVEPTPGCISYTSLLEFKPFSKPGANDTIWAGYVPSNISVRLYV